MKKTRYLAGAAALAPAAAALLVPATAQAAPAAAATSAAGHGKRVSPRPVRAAAATTSRWARIIHGPAPLHLRNGGSETLYDSYSVHVTCYYSGNTGFASDPYWDHVNKIRFSDLGTIATQSVAGHVADVYVNFGGLYPFSVGIPHC